MKINRIPDWNEIYKNSYNRSREREEFKQGFISRVSLKNMTAITRPKVKQQKNKILVLNIKRR